MPLAIAHTSSLICIMVLTERLHTRGKHPGSADWSVEEHHMVPHLQALGHGREVHKQHFTPLFLILNVRKDPIAGTNFSDFSERR